MPFAHSETAEHVRTTLGAVLRRRRDVARKSLAEVAAAAGISTAYLSEVERGRKEISVERLLAVGRALGATIGEVYLELATELGGIPGSEPLAVNGDPRLQVRRMAEVLEGDALRTVARFTTFMAMTEGTQRRRPIGFLR
jgi:transcriptional regulator with XRE-family HTH domain